ncbi:N-alpha-acetyltransferase 50, NatE catalytic subunit, partial [Lichtheimia hyalospora FSU 10163]
MSPQQNDHVALVNVTTDNVKMLSKLNAVLFPVEYGATFYREVLYVGELAKLAYYGGMCVGACCCRPEMDGTRIYIMTLGVLAPYRHLGLGSQLLTHVIRHASRVPRYAYIYLHVQITNQAALSFYQKHGFHIIGMEKNYYRDIEPRDAYILRRINIPSPSH